MLWYAFIPSKLRLDHSSFLLIHHLSTSYKRLTSHILTIYALSFTPYTPTYYCYRLNDANVMVRYNTLTVLTHLILNDMVKVKGQVCEVYIAYILVYECIVYSI